MEGPPNIAIDDAGGTLGLAPEDFNDAAAAKAPPPNG
jgi:hypothetical protein